MGSTRLPVRSGAHDTFTASEECKSPLGAYGRPARQTNAGTVGGPHLGGKVPLLVEGRQDPVGMSSTHATFCHATVVPLDLRKDSSRISRCFSCLDAAPTGLIGAAIRRTPSPELASGAFFETERAYMCGGG